MDQHTDPDQSGDEPWPAGTTRPSGPISFHKASSDDGSAASATAGTGPFQTVSFGTGSFGIRSFGAGSFRAGPPTSDSALRRYLLTRALGRSVISTVQWSGVAILLIAALCWLGGVKLLAVLIGLVAVLVLMVRAALSGLERRLSGAAQLGPLEPRVAALVARTNRGLRRELRRVGLPSLPWAPLLIALRLLRPFRRVETLRALSRIDLASVVPTSQLDELQLLLQTGHR